MAIRNYIGIKYQTDSIENKLDALSIEEGAVDLARLRFWLSL